MAAWGVLHVDASGYITQADLIVVQYEVVMPNDRTHYCNGFVDVQQKCQSRDIAEQRAMKMCACLIELYESGRRKGNGT